MAPPQRTAPSSSADSPGPVKGQSPGSRRRADSDLLGPSHEHSSRCSCLTPSKTTAGFQQAHLFVTKQIVTNLWDKYRIAHPPCFNLPIFVSFVSIIGMNKWRPTMVCFILNEACREWIFQAPAVCLWWVLTGDTIPVWDTWILD